MKVKYIVVLRIAGGFMYEQAQVWHNRGSLDLPLSSRVAEVRSRTEVRTSNHWTGPAGSGAGSPRRMVFKNQFEP
jgi:hypothetical protein